MTDQTRFRWAMTASLLLHGLPLLVSALTPGNDTPRPTPAQRPPLQARLKLVQPELQLKPQPESLSESTKAPAQPPKPVQTTDQPSTSTVANTPADKSNASLTGQTLPYPLEAVSQGIEGEALVMLFLDGSGNVITARIETSSGYGVLDEAAVRAAKQIRTLDSSSKHALLPVRFRLEK